MICATCKLGPNGASGSAQQLSGILDGADNCGLGALPPSRPCFSSGVHGSSWKQISWRVHYFKTCIWFGMLPLTVNSGHPDCYTLVGDNLHINLHVPLLLEAGASQGMIIMHAANCYLEHLKISENPISSSGKSKPNITNHSKTKGVNVYKHYTTALVSFSLPSSWQRYHTKENIWRDLRSHSLLGRIESSWAKRFKLACECLQLRLSRLSRHWMGGQHPSHYNSVQLRHNAFLIQVRTTVWHLDLADKPMRSERNSQWKLWYMTNCYTDLRLHLYFDFDGCSFNPPWWLLVSLQFNEHVLST